MKQKNKILILTLLITLFTGYLSAQNPLNNPKIKEYYTFLKGLDTKDASSVNKSIEQFSILFADSPKTSNDTAYIVFEEFILRVLDEVEFDYKLLMAAENPSSEKEMQEALTYKSLLIRSGFDYKETEDQIIILPNFNAIKSKVYPYLSPLCLEYFQKTENESKEGFIQNDSLLISPRQLAERCLYWEKFLKKHPDFIYNGEISYRYENYLETLIFAPSRDPFFTGKKLKLRKDVKKTYEFLLKEHPFSFTGDIVERYYHLLRQHHFSFHQSLLLFTWTGL